MTKEIKKENRGGKREGAGRKKTGRKRSKTLNGILMSEEEHKYANSLLEKTKKEKNLKNKREALLYIFKYFEDDLS